MFKLNLLLILRNFKRQKGSFLINLVGFSSGLTCAILIYLWVDNEANIDKFNINDQQLYQVLSNTTRGNGIETEDHTPGLFARVIAQEMPEADHAVAVVTPVSEYEGVLSYGRSDIKAKTQFADKNYFEVFTCNFIQGSKNQALSEKQSISLSKTLAFQLFHTYENIIGKTVAFKNQYFEGKYIVAGVFAPQENASSQFDVLFSYDLFLEKRPEIKEWQNGGPCTYVALKKGTDVQQFNAKLTNLIRNKRKESEETMFLQRFSQRYLYGKYENGRIAGGRISYVQLFSLTAIFILIIACINFINLSTAKASLRMKEVGIKKTIGASRKALILQYLGESLLLVSISLMLAILLTAALLPQFNAITGKHLHLGFDIRFILSVLSVGVLTGLAAGSFPAFYISGFNPLAVLKGKLQASVPELVLRKGLVIFQFAVSVVLIVSVLVAYNQIQFVQTKNLGYDKDNIISLVKEGALEKNYQAFIAEVKNIPGVENASYMFGDLAGGTSSRSGGLSWEGQNPTETQTPFSYLDVDYDLIETLGLHITEGRSFSPHFRSDSSAIVFNEAAIHAMGIKDPIGKTVDFYGNRRIIGVVKNFHFESLHEKVKPFFFKIDSETGGNILVKIKAGTERTTIAQIQDLYTKFNPGFPFDYNFLNKRYQAQYLAEQRVSVLSRYFAGLAVLISCLGLFGLAAFTAERRKKEIGIRKVIGATSIQIANLLTAEFSKIVLIAISIALPLSYLLARNWLNSFAYRIELEWWYFILAGLGALIIAAITVGLQAIKAALTNPIKSLRTE